MPSVFSDVKYKTYKYKMASGYNFDEAYSTDSFMDSDWENICHHVGLSLGSDEEIEQKSEDEHEKNNPQE